MCGGGSRAGFLAAVVGCSAYINLPLSLRGHSDKIEARTLDPGCSVVLVVMLVVVWLWW